MGKEVNWWAHALLGLLLTGQAFFSWGAPAGPWQAPSFTIGLLGLVGLGFLWSAKLRVMFGVSAVIPYLDSYRYEREKIPLYIAADAGAGLLAVFILNAIPNNWVITAPEPAAMIMLLYACLMGLHALYAWLVIGGPLKGET